MHVSRNWITLPTGRQSCGFEVAWRQLRDCIVCRSKDGTNQPWRRGSGEIRAWLVINLNLILLIEGIWLTGFGSRYVSTADDERMSEIEQDFEVVRGEQLYWFLAWLLQVYWILTCPKLGGERHLEVEEIRRSSKGFRPDGPGSCTPCFSFAFGGPSVQSGELTIPKIYKITRDNTEKER